MAQKCELCGKGPQFGNNISHAHNTTRRRWNPNLQAVKAKVEGGSKRMRVCTSCIKTGKIVKGLAPYPEKHKAPAAWQLGLFVFRLLSQPISWLPRT